MGGEEDSEDGFIEAEDDSSSNTQTAGVVRALGKASKGVSKAGKAGQGAFKVFSRADIGRLPRPAPKTRAFVGNMSDRITTLYDVYGHAKESIQEFRASTTSQGRHEQLKRLLKNNLYPFARNALLGTVVFSIYELRNKPTHQELVFSASNSDDKTSETKEEAKPQAVGFRSPFIVGAAAGLAHAGGSLFFDVVSKTASGAKLKPGPILVSHSLAHAVLFSTYEGSKTILMSNSDFSSYQGIASVFLSGLAAGVAQEFTSFYGTFLEQHGFRGCWRLFQRKMPRPYFVTVFSPAPATALGFLAFEFAS